MRSLYSKFLIFTMITMVGSAVISFLIVNTYYHQFLKTDNDTKNMHILQHITTFIETNPSIDLPQYLSTQANVGYKMLLIKEDEELSSLQTYGDPFRSLNLDIEIIETVFDGENYHGMRDLPKETFVTGFFSDELANTVGTSFTYDDETYALFLRPNIKMLFNEVHYLLGGLFIGMGIVSLIAMLFVARRLIKPLRQLTTATKKIGAGRFHASLSYKSNDEIGQLARSFTNMTDELKKADTMQKQFITDVSHDLQTPLQQMKGYATLLKDGNLSERETNEYASIIERETERLSNLSRQLLVLTSLDAKREQMPFTTIHVDKQLKDVILRFRWQLEQKGLTLTAEVNEATIRGVESFIEQLWENLLSNAIKYTPDGKEIILTLTEHDEHIVCTIKDQGIGIPTEKLPHVFDRFYRVDDARSTHIEGTGLGLSIIKRIVSLHRGTIDIKSEVGEGTEVTIKLNKNR